MMTASLSVQGIQRSDIAALLAVILCLGSAGSLAASEELIQQLILRLDQQQREMDKQQSELDELFPDDLVTLTIMPGFEYQLPITPEWTITDVPDIHSDIENVHELGFSVGLKKPRKILGISFNRVRVGHKSGGDIKGFTIGGEFPF